MIEELGEGVGGRGGLEEDGGLEGGVRAWGLVAPVPSICLMFGGAVPVPVRHLAPKARLPEQEGYVPEGPIPGDVKLFTVQIGELCHASASALGNHLAPPAEHVVGREGGGWVKGAFWAALGRKSISEMSGIPRGFSNK